jgi:hypothetical protein
VTTLEFLRDEIKRNTQEARKIMHLSTDGVGAQGEATEKTALQSGFDQRSMYAFVAPIIGQIFTLMRFLHDSAGGLRFGSEYKGIELRQPTSFDIRTEADLINELTAIAGQPPAIIAEVLWAWVKARFAHDARALKTFETLWAADTLFVMKPGEIAAMKADGTIEPWQVVLHFQAESIYDQLARDGKLTGEVDKDAEAMRELAKTNTPKPPEKTGMDKLKERLAA